MARTRRPTPTDYPHTEDTWLLIVRKLRAWITPEDEPPTRPYLTLIFNRNQNLIQGISIEDKPKPAKVKKNLFSAMVKSDQKARLQPGRPAKVIFEDSDLRDALAPALNEIGVQALYRSNAHQELDTLVQDLEAHMREGEPEIPGLLSAKETSVKLVAAFFEASANFFRAAPWIELRNEDYLAIRVLPQTEPYFVAVMGHGGVAYGLSLHKRWADIERMNAPADDPIEMIPDDGMHSLNFSEIIDVPFNDLEDIEKYRWSIAAPDAYPTPMIYTPQGEALRPNADQLLWYEAVLRAVPEFVRDYVRMKPDGELESAETIIKVPTSAGVRSVEIRIADEVLQPAAIAPHDPLEYWDEPDELSIPFDRRAMEGDLAHLFEDEELSGFDAKVREAQDLMYTAWDEPNTVKRILFAHKALEISEDCADAYVLLAEEEAGSLEDAFKYYQKGVFAGKRALGKDYFKENHGYFWGLVETRPYMRAIRGYADCLWQLKRKDEALKIYQEMLLLNPSDNQGIRYVLVDLYLTLGRDAELGKLIRQFKDDWSAVWLYTQALLAFRKSGPSAQAERKLAMALEENAHVVAYLTGKKRIPKHIPERIEWGGESEAVEYAANHLNYWRKTPGAVEWLRDLVDDSKGHS